MMRGDDGEKIDRILPIITSPHCLGFKHVEQLLFSHKLVKLCPRLMENVSYRKAPNVDATMESGNVSEFQSAWHSAKLVFPGDPRTQMMPRLRNVRCMDPIVSSSSSRYQEKEEEEPMVGFKVQGSVTGIAELPQKVCCRDERRLEFKLIAFCREDMEICRLVGIEVLSYLIAESLQHHPKLEMLDVAFKVNIPMKQQQVQLLQLQDEGMEPTRFLGEMRNCYLFFLKDHFLMIEDSMELRVVAQMDREVKCWGWGVTFSATRMMYTYVNTLHAATRVRELSKKEESASWQRYKMADCSSSSGCNSSIHDVAITEEDSKVADDEVIEFVNWMCSVRGGGENVDTQNSEVD